MAITANDIETLHAYASGVMNRADHHAGRVKAIALALLGGIIWKAAPGSIEIKQHDGNLANVLWFNVQEKRYAFSYNHESQKIEMRDRTVQGATLHEFSNATPVDEIEKIFRSL